MVCTGYEGCDHCRKYKTTPSILSLFSLSYTNATATLSGENIHLHILNVYVNKVVKEHPTKVILEDADFFLLT